MPNISAPKKSRTLYVTIDCQRAATASSSNISSLGSLRSGRRRQKAPFPDRLVRIVDLQGVLVIENGLSLLERNAMLLYVRLAFAGCQVNRSAATLTL
jgi:hypothetical protein